MSPQLAARLQLLESQLSTRDRRILHLIARFRLLSGRQLQQVVFGEVQYRTSRRVLARLVSLGLLATLERRIGGVRAGSAGFVYCLAPDGQRIVAAEEQRELGRASKLREPSLRTIQHTLAIGEVFAAIKSLELRGKLSVEAFDPEPSCWRPYLAGFGGKRTLKPDAFVQTASKAWDYFWFIEVDRSTESVATLKRKIGHYIEYWRSGTEQAKSGTFPKVFWITNTERQLVRLSELFGELPPEHERLFQAGLSGDEAALFLPSEGV